MKPVRASSKLGKPIVWTELPIPAAHRRRLSSLARVINGPNLVNAIGADVTVIGDAYVDREFLQSVGPNLKAVIRHGIGYDRVDVDACSDLGVLVVNTPDGPTEATAEHAVLLLLALAKRLPQAQAIIRSGDWSLRSELMGTEVKGRTVGIVGLGRIGNRVATVCALGLGMNVIGYDPYTGPGSSHTAIERVASLDDLLQRCDFVSLHLPLSAATVHLIGAAELSALGPAGYLINTSRGAIIDEGALVSALRDGVIAGAAIDVFEHEPLADDSPLLKSDAVILTPHVAANTTQSMERMAASVVDQAIDVLHGRRPRHLVNATAWPGRLAAR